MPRLRQTHPRREPRHANADVSCVLVWQVVDGTRIMATLIVVAEFAGSAVIGRGGQAMYVLQWLHGFERAGHQVYFMEFLKDDPGAATNAVVTYYSDIVRKWWNPDRCALILEEPTKSLYGLDVGDVAQVARRADALITIAAYYRRDPPSLIVDVRPRILIEQDPGYTHIWAADGDPADIFGEQDIYFTVGGNIGSARCRVPTSGIEWRPVWNPVVLDWWRPQSTIDGNRFTTVADWRGYGFFEFEDQILGPKSEEFRKYIGLPKLADEPFTIVLNIDPEDPDIELLEENGWRLEDPALINSPQAYLEFISGSVGEFSCTKGGYAGTRSGWFSDRSACYLAAGRPVVLQSTGFEDLLPNGQGLFAVSSPEEAAEAVREIRGNYEMHSAAARMIAAEHFDSEEIVSRVLTAAGLDTVAG